MDTYINIALLLLLVIDIFMRRHLSERISKTEDRLDDLEEEADEQEALACQRQQTIHQHLASTRREINAPSVEEVLEAGRKQAEASRNTHMSAIQAENRRRFNPATHDDYGRPVNQTEDTSLLNLALGVGLGVALSQPSDPDPTPADTCRADDSGSSSSSSFGD